jgi:hypothetical protein
MMFKGAFDCAFTIQVPVTSKKNTGRMRRAPGPTRFIGDSPLRV